MFIKRKKFEEENEMNENTSGAWIVAGTASGALIAGVPGAIIGAIAGYIFQEIVRCPQCGNNMNWNQELKRYICNVCNYIR